MRFSTYVAAIVTFVAVGAIAAATDATTTTPRVPSVLEVAAPAQSSCTCPCCLSTPHFPGEMTEHTCSLIYIIQQPLEAL